MKNKILIVFVLLFFIIGQAGVASSVQTGAPLEGTRGVYPGSRDIGANMVPRMEEAKNIGFQYFWVGLTKRNINSYKNNGIDYHAQLFQQAQATGMKIILVFDIKLYDPNLKYDSALSSDSTKTAFINDVVWALNRYKQYSPDTFAGIFIEEPFYHTVKIDHGQDGRDNLNSFFVRLRTEIDKVNMGLAFNIGSVSGTNIRCPSYNKNGVLTAGGVESMGLDPNYISNNFNTPGQCRTDDRKQNALNKPLFTFYAVNVLGGEKWKSWLPDIQIMETSYITTSSILHSTACLNSGSVGVNCRNQDFFTQLIGSYNRQVPLIVFSMGYVESTPITYWTLNVNAAYPGASTALKINNIFGVAPIIPIPTPSSSPMVKGTPVSKKIIKNIPETPYPTSPPTQEQKQNGGKNWLYIGIIAILMILIIYIRRRK